MTTIRNPAVAGLFYPAGTSELQAAVRAYLEEARPPPGPAPKAMIVPHAGYIYSGSVAAAAFSRLDPHRDRYRRVVLLGPCHRVALRGLAVSDADVFRTPLGDVPLDKATIAGLDFPYLRCLEDTHRHEHSLEVHLPFLQSLLDRFTLVPLVVGAAAPETVSDVLDVLWGGNETLIVVSSDLSHYLPYRSAIRRDRSTCDAIERLDAHALGFDDACGAVPVAGLLIAAKRRGLHVSTLDLRNSGDTAGGRDRVVGYGAWVLSEPETRASDSCYRQAH